MSVTALTGKDTISLAGRNLTALGDGDVAKLTIPNDLTTQKAGKDGNGVVALNATGGQGELELRIIRGSSDDAFLNSLLAQMRADFPSFPLMNGNLVKRIGAGDGSVSNDTYICRGGSFAKIPEVNSNVEGNTDQGLTIYRIKFLNIKRANM